jgi:VIT family
MIAGVAGLVAGAMSRAADEYVSVGAQSDTEQADLARERKELSPNAEFERLDRTCAVDFFDTWASTGALERCNVRRPLFARSMKNATRDRARVRCA